MEKQRKTDLLFILILYILLIIILVNNHLLPVKTTSASQKFCLDTEDLTGKILEVQLCAKHALFLDTKQQAWIHSHCVLAEEGRHASLHLIACAAFSKQPWFSRQRAGSALRLHGAASSSDAAHSSMKLRSTQHCGFVS